jgi:hypothetical protein
MKRLLCAFAIACFLVPAFADIPDRVVELGTDLGAGAGNSYFTWSSFFNADQTLVVDINDMAAALGGFSVNASASERSYLNLKISKLSLGAFLDLSVYSYAGIPDSLLQLLANGNAPDTDYSGSFDLKGDVFVSLGLSGGYTYGPITASISPSYYMPIVHVDKPVLSFALDATQAGGYAATATADIPVYSAASLADPGNIDIMQALGTALGSGGVDVTLAGAYQLLPELSVGGRAKNIPIFPARMNERFHVAADYSFELGNILANIDTGNFFTMSAPEPTTVADQAPIQVFRPFKLGVNAVYKPQMLDFLSLSPNMDFVIYDSKTAYVDGGIKAEANLANLGIFSLSMGIEDLIWKNQLSMALNLRILELDFLIGMQSGDFFKNFALSGAYAGLSLKIGY